jgi:nicotinamidase-related amidase
VQLADARRFTLQHAFANPIAAATLSEHSAKQARRTGWGTLRIGIERPRAAIVTIDLHRGHLDPAVATMPASPEIAALLVDNNRRLLESARPLGIPIVHCVTTYRDVEEIRANPFWRTRAEDSNATRKNVLRHNLAGSPGCTIMPGLQHPTDFVVETKKRYDCFQGTDLDTTLRTHGIDTVLITGINTNSCVLATVCAANVRDYAVIVIEDCVNTMDSPAHHDAALMCVRTAFGFVASSAEVLELARSWTAANA